jgi:hypothetical protein
MLPEANVGDIGVIQHTLHPDVLSPRDSGEPNWTLTGLQVTADSLSAGVRGGETGV